jgi:hypothetical protein
MIDLYQKQGISRIAGTAKSSEAFLPAMARQPITRKWTTDDHVKLRRLWNKPLSIASIARRMGRSRETIKEKAEALALPPKTGALRQFNLPMAKKHSRRHATGA